MGKNLSTKIIGSTDRAKVATEQWQRERPDLDVLPMAVIGRLKEVSQLVQRDHLDPLFAAKGLTRGDFDVLATLRRAGAPYALTPTALYDATMVTSGAMTGRIERLALEGLVERAENPEDRRGTLVKLTSTGFAMIDLMMTEHVENERRILAGLTRSEQEKLAELLSKLLATLPPPYESKDISK